MRRRGLVVALVVALCLAPPGWLLFKSALMTLRAAPSGKPVTVEIPRGTGLAKTAELLAQAQVVEHPWLFMVAARLSGRGGHLRAGEYSFSPAMTLDQILDTLVRGKVLQHKLMIPEGFTLEQIADRLQEIKLAKKDEVLALARDARFLGKLGLKGTDSLEGYLFPDTYFFARGLEARAILTAMAQRFLKVWKDLADQAATRGLSRRKAVILASIIEREAQLDSERPLVSAVYQNRLDQGMRLQADPTVIYGLDDDLEGPLLRRHLEQESPYNTYLNKGLPPGPICSPGKASLVAAVNPAQAGFLYFVAKGDGSHHFSKTYREHAQAVRRYRNQR